MNDFVRKLAREYNEYSALTALGWQAKESGAEVDEGVVEWNRGHDDCLKKVIEEAAELAGATLEWYIATTERTIGENTRKAEHKAVRVKFD